jgi:hypothetical protein
MSIVEVRPPTKCKGAQGQTGDVVGVARTSKRRKAVGSRDRLRWRHTSDRRLLLCHRRGRNPLVTLEPDSKCTGMYRIRFPDGGLSDMVNLTRAKHAALAFALQALNCKTQETPPDASYVRQKRSAVPNTRRTSKRLHEPRTGFLAKG